ncbi:serine/threonine-protein kinase [Kitasatospora sp. NPDC101183]|uniref:serine/threonine-protein kinase n=1 Tax=Kitasatospora sp. NPDC101183 TaxID=3364100 RepID=UPI00380DD273
MRPTDPTVIGGRYRLLARLGAGGMGVVYLGRSPGGRLVAVKCVHWDLATDPGFRRRFTRELEAARRVGGFHTAQVVDADTEGDPPWIVTAYIPGPSLTEAVAEHGPLPEPVLRILGAGLAEALAAVHAAGLVHRDLKPSNVLLGEDGPRVIDFGIARALDGASITRTQTVIGTPGYMAPEQIAGGELGPACDLFSLGRVLCHAAGADPYGAGTPQVLLYRIMNAEPDLSGVPVTLRPLVAACLARRPEDRPTPGQVLALLGPPAYGGPSGSWLPEPLRLRAQVPVPAPVPAPVPLPAPVPATPTAVVRPPVRRWRRPWVLVPSALALVAAAVVVPLSLTDDTKAKGSGLTNDGFVVAKDGGGSPDCVMGGISGAGGAVDAGQGPPRTVPSGTPHPPTLGTPAHADSMEPGQAVELTWTRTGSVTRVFTALAGSSDWRASGWLATASCTFRPSETGLYQWAVLSADGATGTVSSGWSEVRYLDVRPPGTPGSVKGLGIPAAPVLVAPSDQAGAKAGQPIQLSWASPEKHADVSILAPGAKDWQRMPWQDGTTFLYTPPTPGTYLWVVDVLGQTACKAVQCVGPSSEQRYLIVQ